MAQTDVEICNLALTHIGQRAQVSSIEPVDGSAESTYCAVYYPVARDLVLEMHNWSFCMTRAALALTVEPLFGWLYAYVKPNDSIKIIGVYPPDSPGDIGYPRMSAGYCSYEYANYDNGQRTSQAFVEEQGLILTDQESAYARYKQKITDTSKYSTMVSMTISYQLAALLAGPMIKGDAGTNKAKEMLALMSNYLGKAKAENASSQQNIIDHVPEHLRR
jgi:hypothetical protein